MKYQVIANSSLMYFTTFFLSHVFGQLHTSCFPSWRDYCLIYFTYNIFRFLRLAKTLSGTSVIAFLDRYLTTVNPISELNISKWTGDLSHIRHLFSFINTLYLHPNDNSFIFSSLFNSNGTNTIQHRTKGLLDDVFCFVFFFPVETTGRA